MRLPALAAGCRSAAQASGCLSKARADALPMHGDEVGCSVDPLVAVVSGAKKPNPVPYQQTQ